MRSVSNPLASIVPDDALKLLISILAGYPLSVIYRTLFCSTSQQLQHLYFIITGLILYWLNYGVLVFHSIIAIVNAYIIVRFFAGTKLSVVLAHTIFLGHLLLGYWVYETDGYDLNWTTPFCVMTLRLIGLVMDVYDGQKEKENLKGDQLKTAISDLPSLAEIAAFCYIYCGTFVGHLFPLARFRSFINGEFLDNNKSIRDSGMAASINRFLISCIYGIFYCWGCYWIPSSYFNTSKFHDSPLYVKLIITTIWFRVMTSKYVFCWLCNEGAAMLCGIAYNGRNPNGSDRWDGCRDMKVLRWEFGVDFRSCVHGFNIGTNTFVKNYIFKRLQWLGNKFLSHFITLMYLAIWHGYHLGYFVVFLYELVCMNTENRVLSILNKVPWVQSSAVWKYSKPIRFIILRILLNVSMSVGFLTFGLIKYRIWIKPLASMYFITHIFYLAAWPLLILLEKKMMHKKGSMKF